MVSSEPKCTIDFQKLRPHSVSLCICCAHKCPFRWGGVKAVLETVQWTVSGLNGRSPGRRRCRRHHLNAMAGRLRNGYAITLSPTACAAHIRARTEGQEAKRPRHAAGVRLARRGRFGRCPIGDWAFWNVRYRIEANLPKPPRDQPDQNLFRAPCKTSPITMPDQQKNLSRR